MVVIDEDEGLVHYGTKRHSGRYAWGSGGNELPRGASFLDLVDDLKRQGLSQPDIARGLGIGSVDRNGEFKPSTTQLRAKVTIALQEKKQEQIARAWELKDKGYSGVAAAKNMGIPESTYRSLLAPGAKDRADALTSTADMLKAEVEAKTYVDIGAGVEHDMKVAPTRLNAAVSVLKEQGYQVHTIPVTTAIGNETKTKVLAPPGTTWGDVKKNQDKIQQIASVSDDGGRTFISKPLPPLPVNPKRVAVKYGPDGGDKEDGVIYVRRGVKDVAIGNAPYAQVRVQVGKNHYLKGMAIYKDDLPDGVDLLFNTNKTDTGNKLDAMKELKRDIDGNISEDLPFGSVVRQIVDKPGTPNAKVVSAMNIVGTKEGSGEEGSWDKWSKTLSSQFLSKQSPRLAKEQLDVTSERRKRELDEIMALTNPTIKKRLLEDFADSTDSAAVHLKAANMPGQATRVILPLNSLKPTEVYAPGFNDGDRVALIRFPHGGTFEIPEVTVNNKHAQGRKLLGDAKDAIGINHEVAKHLSGADFDGDTVLVIPNNSGKIKTSPALEKLKNFDPQQYKLPKDSPIPKMDARTKGIQMGKVSNLITDMTIQQASHDDLAKAVKHSMVVIDAEKHNLDWRQSAKDNEIRRLYERYQGKASGGASTLVSRKKSYKLDPEIKLRPASQGGPVDPETGRRVFVPSGRTRVNKDGVREPIRKKINLLDQAHDAYDLVSGPAATPIEKLYADHSNRLKNMANQARLAALKTPRLKYSPQANKIYKAQVARLNSALALAERNAPRERQAQILAGSIVKARRQANPDMEPATLKKIKFQAQTEARIRTGASKEQIDISQDEWDAIQAGAISDNRLSRILRHADMDRVRELATPRREILMSPNMTTRARQMLSSGATRAEVARALGVSLTTLDTATNE